MTSQWEIFDNGETLVGSKIYKVSTREVYKDAEFISHIAEKMWVDAYDFYVVACQAFEMCGLEVKPKHDRAMRKGLKAKADDIMYDVIAERWRRKFRPDLKVGMFEAPDMLKTAQEMLADLYERV